MAAKSLYGDEIPLRQRHTPMVATSPMGTKFPYGSGILLWQPHTPMVGTLLYGSDLSRSNLPQAREAEGMAPEMQEMAGTSGDAAEFSVETWEAWD